MDRIPVNPRGARILVEQWLTDASSTDLDPLTEAEKHFLFTMRMYFVEKRLDPSPKQIKWLFDLHKMWLQYQKDPLLDPHAQAIRDRDELWCRALVATGDLDLVARVTRKFAELRSLKNVLREHLD